MIVADSPEALFARTRDRVGEAGHNAMVSHRLTIDIIDLERGQLFVALLLPFGEAAADGEEA
jgi:hypothetical protein